MQRNRHSFTLAQLASTVTFQMITLKIWTMETISNICTCCPHHANTRSETSLCGAPWSSAAKWQSGSGAELHLGQETSQWIQNHCVNVKDHDSSPWSERGGGRGGNREGCTPHMKHTLLLAPNYFPICGIGSWFLLLLGLLRQTDQPAQ